MQTLHKMRSGQSYSSHNRYAAGNMAKPVNFFCVAPEAELVTVVGDFNDWRPNIHPMQRQSDGSWHLQIPLHHGHHHYTFLVDGKPVLDPRAMGIARNEKNERVSLIAVS
jgi:1,4-alpha-glucan branching enzyme